MEYFDFNKFIKIFNGEYGCAWKYDENVKDFMDKKVNKKYRIPYLDMINNIKSEKFIKYDFNLMTDGLINHSSIFYETIDKKYLLFNFILKNKDGYHLQCSGVVNKDIYLIVGCIRQHPFIVTDTFTYDNSDGSGPDFEANNENDILNNLEKYFKEFCDDIHH